MSTPSSRAVTPKTRRVFVANPNNPTGTYLPVRRGQAAAGRRCRANVLLVIDAAYAEYVKRNDYEAGIELVATTENVVMTRTFSKIHGLAALRVGWMLRAGACRRRASTASAAPSTCRRRRCSPPSPRSRIPAISRSARAHNDQWRGWLTEEIGKLGLTVTPSAANFVLIHFPTARGKTRRRCRRVPHQARTDPARLEELRTAEWRCA